MSPKGIALRQELLVLSDKLLKEEGSPSEDFYSRMFVVQRASGVWHLMIDLSSLNHFIHKTKFWMETSCLVLQSVRQNDRTVFNNLKDAFLQIPAH